MGSSPFELNLTIWSQNVATPHYFCRSCQSWMIPSKLKLWGWYQDGYLRSEVQVDKRQQGFNRRPLDHLPTGIVVAQPSIVPNTKPWPVLWRCFRQTLPDGAGKESCWGRLPCSRVRKRNCMGQIRPYVFTPLYNGKDHRTNFLKQRKSIRLWMET